MYISSTLEKLIIFPLIEKFKFNFSINGQIINLEKDFQKYILIFFYFFLFCIFLFNINFYLY